MTNLTAGIDVGSTYTKAALLDDEGTLVATAMIQTGFRLDAAANEAYAILLRHADVAREDVAYVVSTGAGRSQVPFRDLHATDLTAQGRGTRHFFPHTRTVLDVGGQTMKASRLDDRGRVAAFRLNDKCAAGTGRFLEVMAGALEVGLDDFGPISLTAEAPAVISSLCTVFAESEVISLISKGARRRDIIAGIHAAIAARVVAMAGRIGLTAPVMMTGGVAKNIGVVKAIEARIGSPVVVSSKAQLTGAIGAALIAARPA